MAIRWLAGCVAVIMVAGNAVAQSGHRGWRGGEITVAATGCDYTNASGATAGNMQTGQAADMMLSGFGFNNAGGGLQFNHPGGMATDGTRLVLADRNNNRVLIWNSAPTAGAAPDLVLGQSNFTTNNPGTGLNEFNWPVGVSLAANGRLVVSDAYNDRILVWNEFPATNGEAADFALHIPDFSGGISPFNWPWGVWTDGTRLVVAVTFGEALLFWNTFPTDGSDAPDFKLHDKAFGTLRTITSDGTYLIVDDHNTKLTFSGPGFGMATYVYSEFPTSAADTYDFAITGERLRGGTVDGKLVLLGGKKMQIWNQFPTDATDTPDVSVAGPWNGDCQGLAVAGNKMYTFDENQNSIWGYDSLPDSSDDLPDFAVGSPDTATNSLALNYVITNPNPISDGNSLFVVSDFDRKIYVWKQRPAQTGACPDYVYETTNGLWTGTIHDGKLIVAGYRDIMVWNALPLNGEMPNTTITAPIGGEPFDQIRGVAMDGSHFYLSDFQMKKIAVWPGVPAQDEAPTFVIDVGSTPGKISSDGTWLAVPCSEPSSVKLYRVADLAAGAQPFATITSPQMNLPQGLYVGNGLLAVADTSFNRVLVWNSVDAAAAGGAPDVILGHANLNQHEPGIGADRLFMPGAVWHDGDYWWVGEFKFSNRLLRYSPQGAVASAASGWVAW